MKRRLIGTAAAATILLASNAFAVEVRLATFNLAWAGTEEEFAAHVSVCEKVKWCSNRPQGRHAGAREVARAQACQKAMDEAAGSHQEALNIPPCDAYELTPGKLGQPPQLPHELYQQKLAGLRTTIGDLITQQHVDVIAFQEVSSDAVIRDLLGRHLRNFSVCVAPAVNFQTVGFAWRKSIGRNASCAAEPALAINKWPDQPDSLAHVRPGLRLSMKVNNTDVSFMTVHLKTDCEHAPADGQGNTLADRDPHCRVLNRQLVPLENWIRKVHAETPLFVLFGDFSRRLLDEEKMKLPYRQVRTDGSHPSVEHRVIDPLGHTTSRYLWPELAAGPPPLVLLQPKDPAPCNKRSGVDHFILSQPLADRQQRRANFIKVRPAQTAGQVIESSDHCAKVTGIDI